MQSYEPILVILKFGLQVPFDSDRLRFVLQLWRICVAKQ